jgi:hypothetical protein
MEPMMYPVEGLPIRMNTADLPSCTSPLLSAASLPDSTFEPQG